MCAKFQVSRRFSFAQGMKYKHINKNFRANLGNPQGRIRLDYMRGGLVIILYNCEHKVNFEVIRNDDLHTD